MVSVSRRRARPTSAHHVHASLLQTRVRSAEDRSLPNANVIAHDGVGGTSEVSDASTTDQTLHPPGDGTSTGGEMLAPGAAIGRYVVLGRVGAGAMGVVYAAYDPDLDRKIALKLLKPRSGDADESVRKERL